MSRSGSWGVPAGLPDPSGPYSLASATPEGLIHTAGLVALDAAGTVVGKDDAAAQTREIFAQARTILCAAGAALADVVFAHVFVSDMRHYEAINAAYREAFAETGRPLPPRYCIRADLVKDSLLVEIAFVARKGG
ncbi:RidA family protein [Rhizorhabdus histidinilytica]|uniref:Aminoacrylate peracid reductase/2-iminobutanoate/2-iminopropanoate deaminase n=1 Tax=Rhizorhabdus histidinilytica TaxID=439228 RepID=A0A1T5EL64_9SPHN|nr:RidA family protein [Rhizorhabdus histidinilytica]SKB84704.1 aminoacrylate peracid reductase/2-iminobutanoate/2-iminopropanoate deaminase [Rhizorhabdus histidinilytica]